MRMGRLVSVAAAAMAAFYPVAAMSYIGPGAGLSAIGTILALIGAVLLAVFGFVWYPIKRLLAKLRERAAARKETSKQPPK